MKNKLVILLSIMIVGFINPCAALSAPVDEGYGFCGILDDHGLIMMLIEPQSGDITCANKAALSFYGYNREELLSMNISQINTLDEKQIAVEMQQAVNENRNYFLFKHRLANDEVRTVEVYSYPTEYTGRPMLLSIVYDVTEQKLLEAKYRKMRTVFAAAGILTFMALSHFLINLNKKAKTLGKLQQNQERVFRRNKLLLDVLGRNFKSKQEQLDYALHQLLKLSGSEYGYIYFYDEETEQFNLNSWTKGVMEDCTVSDKPKVYPLSHTGIWGEVVRQRKPLIINDFQHPHPLKKGYPEGHVQLNRFMSVPVFIDDQIVAVVGLGNKPTNYTNDDVYEMGILMSGVWNAVQRRESTERLGYERKKYYQTLLSIGDGVMIIDRNRNIEMINQAACNLTGWSQEEAIGVNYKRVFILSPDQEGSAIEDPIEKVFLTEEVHRLGSHALLISKNGQKYNLEDSAAPIRDDKGALAGVVLVFKDVTDERKHQKEIEYISYHDSLTGLYNRHYFKIGLKRIDTEPNLPISIIVGDINNLKLANDIYGHSFGDELIKRIAGVMKSICRAGDIIARWGGDEFVLLLPKTGPAEAEGIAQRIKRKVSAQQIRAIQCSISVGVDTKQVISKNIVKTFGNAESKMYDTKTLERSRVQNLELETIITTLFKNSEWEKQHAHRVSSMCGDFGAILNLSPPALLRLQKAGRLNNIGKVVLPPHLLKPEQKTLLTAGQQKELAEHPLIGYRILNYFDNTRDLAGIILAHHEYWDGSGFPKGLKGGNIPLPARIISIVGSYDHLLFGSSQGTAVKNCGEVITKIRSMAGTKFDPKLVHQFAEMIEAGQNTCPENG